MVHTCGGIVEGGSHPQAPARFIARHFLNKLRDDPTYKPCQLRKDINRELNITVPYKRAWQASEIGRQIIHGSDEESYQLLPRYCQQILKCNTNSTAVVESTEENKFRRLFISYGASACGFSFCRSIIGLDGTHLKGKYLGILLTATAVDANNSLFPFAFAVVDAENDENWLWFLQILQDIISKHAPNHLINPSQLILLSDRQKGLIEAVEKLCLASPHRYCLRHLS